MSGSGDLETKLVRLGWAVVLVLAFACQSSARAKAQDVQRFYPALSDAGFLGLDGTRTPGMLRGSISAFGDLAIDPVRLRGVGATLTPVETRLMLHVAAELGLWGRAAVALRLPLIAYQDGGTLDHSQVFALTDPQLWARYRLLGPSMADKNAPLDGPGLSIEGGVSLPFGKQASVARTLPAGAPPVAGRAFASDGRPHSDVQLVFDFNLLGAGFGASVGYRHHFWDLDSVPASATGVRDEFTFAAALKLPVPALPILSGVLELRGASGFAAARDTALELDLGARCRVGSLLIVLGGGLGLSDGVGVPDGRVMLGLYFVPPKSDRDDDGVDDADDQCPFLAEDRDGFQDEDGCPDPDNDNDLVPDLDDKCPSDAAEEGKDENEDGCTDGTTPAG
jgi:OOP family OmpA-OmpF porin